MKKFVFVSLALASVAILAVSCKDREDNPLLPDVSHKISLNKSIDTEDLFGLETLSIRPDAKGNYSLMSESNPSLLEIDPADLGNIDHKKMPEDLDVTIQDLPKILDKKESNYTLANQGIVIEVNNNTGEMMEYSTKINIDGKVLDAPAVIVPKGTSVIKFEPELTDLDAEGYTSTNHVPMPSLADPLKTFPGTIKCTDQTITLVPEPGKTYVATKASGLSFSTTLKTDLKLSFKPGSKLVYTYDMSSIITSPDLPSVKSKVAALTADVTNTIPLTFSVYGKNTDGEQNFEIVPDVEAGTSASPATTSVKIQFTPWKGWDDLKKTTIYFTATNNSGSVVTLSKDQMFKIAANKVTFTDLKLF